MVSGHVWLPTAALAGAQNISIRKGGPRGQPFFLDTAWEQAVGSPPHPPLQPRPHSRSELEGQRLMESPLSSPRNTWERHPGLCTQGPGVLAVQSRPP